MFSLKQVIAILFTYLFTMTDTEKDYSESETVSTTETPEKDYSQTETETPQEKPETKEEVEYIDKKRHAEIVHGKEAELQKARNVAIESAYKYAVNTDAWILLEINKEDPKLAKAVADKIDWESSEYGTFENFLKWRKVSSEDDFETKYEQRRKKEVHEESLKKAQKVIDKLPDDVKEEAQAYFDDIIEGKTLNEDKALKYAEMATTYVNKDKVKKDTKSEAEKILSSTNLPKGWTNAKATSWDTRVRDAKLNKLVNLSS